MHTFNNLVLWPVELRFPPSLCCPECLVFAHHRMTGPPVHRTYRGLRLSTHLQAVSTERCTPENTHSRKRGRLETEKGADHWFHSLQTSAAAMPGGLPDLARLHRPLPSVFYMKQDHLRVHSFIAFPSLRLYLSVLEELLDSIATASATRHHGSPTGRHTPLPLEPPPLSPPSPPA